LSFQISDHLGSSNFLTDALGHAYEFRLYLPFGESMVEQSNGDWESPYRYTGQELDGLTGLYYYGARYYDPVVSNFMGVDPLADKFPGWSPYNYTMNNPINMIDPDGLSPIDPTDPPAPDGGGVQVSVKSDIKFKLQGLQVLSNSISELLPENKGVIKRETVFGGSVVVGKSPTNLHYTIPLKSGSGPEIAISGKASFNIWKSLFTKVGRGLGRSATIVSIASLSIDGYDVTQGDLNPMRFTFRAGTFASSVYTSTSVGAAYGNVYGAAAGLGIGVLGHGAEKAYDIAKPAVEFSIRESIDWGYWQIFNGWKR